MFDVFTEEIEVLIKDGIANLYWFHGDLQKAFLRAGVEDKLVKKLVAMRNADGTKLSKRRVMDQLYTELRTADFNRRLEISRNLVRILVNQKGFTPQGDGHRVEVAERAALKLRQIIAAQDAEQEQRRMAKQRAAVARRDTYDSQRAMLNDRFLQAIKLEPQKRGIELEKIFSELVRISGLPVEEPFRIVGEQIDGAVKYDSRYYLVELRWREPRADQQQIAGLYIKVEGKLDARGIFLAMNGYSSEVLQSLPKGKTIKVVLLDGLHLTNVLCGNYTLNELLGHAIRNASLRGEIYCPHDLPA
ncbi:MAG: hypothetical protein QOE82_358 [Thermoanaerobaculia bacterium]|jgi:hypothetical protein|nr:hypothetical protein [Thermoanaerobaculia bacterium]